MCPRFICDTAVQMKIGSVSFSYVLLKRSQPACFVLFVLSHLQVCPTTCKGTFTFCMYCVWKNKISNVFRDSSKSKYLTLFMFLSPTNALLYYIYKMLKYTVKISHDCSYMFRSIWTIIREPMPNLTKVTILCRYSVKIRR